MPEKNNILAIIGSAGANSANLKLVEQLALLTTDNWNLSIYNELKALPPFDPELSVGDTPEQIMTFRKAVDQADGVIVCTPEYIFSIPAGLKNAIEWCISTTVFSNKPMGLITASASGEKAHEELQLIMKTAMSKFTNETTLLIRGIKGKFDAKGRIIDPGTHERLGAFVRAFTNLVNEKDSRIPIEPGQEPGQQ